MKHTEKDRRRKRVCIPQRGLAKSRSKSRPASSLVVNSVWSQLRRKDIQWRTQWGWENRYPSFSSVWATRYLLIKSKIYATSWEPEWYKTLCGLRECFRHCGGNTICFGSSSHSTVGEKVFHNIPTTSRTCWQRRTELREQTFPICGCWEEIYWLLFRVKKKWPQLYFCISTTGDYSTVTPLWCCVSL